MVPKTPIHPEPPAARPKGPRPVRARQLLGKYKVVRRVDEGGFAMVYSALDTIEGIQVALKIPHKELVDRETLAGFKKEVRLTARFEHPNILPLKNASFIDERFVVVYPLGQCSLAERLQRRISFKTAFDLSEQLLEALAYAHDQKVVHCDVKPENLILFSDGRLRLTDFGIAKLALRTLRAEGTGTLGYIAPEQAMGKPSFRSDVFSAGLVMWQLFTGELPEWPFEWPMRGSERLRGRVHPELIAFLRRALEPHPRKRFANARQMLQTWQRIRPRVLAFQRGPATRRAKSKRNHWKTVRRRQFLRQYRRVLDVVHECEKCRGPVSEAMRTCPWCGRARRVHRQEVVAFPLQCPRCGRGLKSDWRYCPWCYGPALGPATQRRYADRRYSARCTKNGCPRKDLMPFMRYCPWCRTKVKRAWRIEGASERCKSCGWGVIGEYWEHCPWCAKRLGPRKG